MIRVVSAVIFDPDDSQKILVQKRGGTRELHGHWESPGGKIEHGETPTSALDRELYEELGIRQVSIDLEPLLMTRWDPPLMRKSCTVTFYACTIRHDQIAQIEMREDQLRVGFYRITDLLKRGDELMPSLHVLSAYLRAR